MRVKRGISGRLLAVIAATAVAAGGAAALSLRPAAPVLVVPALPLALIGKPADRIEVGTVFLKNMGDSPLDFSIQASCGCSQLHPASGRIPGRALQPVQVGVSLPVAGSEKSVILTISTNAAASRRTLYVIKASRPPYASASPARLDLGPVSPEGYAQGELDIVAAAGSVVDLRTCEFLLDGDGFAFRFISPRSARKARVRLSSAPATVLRSAHAVLRVNDQTIGTLLEVPISLRVEREIVLAPSLISLKHDSKSPQELKIIVRRPHGGSLGRLVIFNAPANMAIRFDSAPSRSTRLYTLTVDWDGARPIDARVLLRFEGSDQRCEIQVLGHPPATSETKAPGNADSHPRGPEIKRSTNPLATE